MLGLELDPRNHLSVAALFLVVAAGVAVRAWLAGLPGFSAMGRRPPDAGAAKLSRWTGPLPIVYLRAQARIRAFRPAGRVGIRRLPGEEANVEEGDIACVEGRPPLVSAPAPKTAVAPLVRLAACALALVAAGCATRSPEVRVAHVDPAVGYRIENRLERVIRNDPETLLVLAFSGGGTRAAAFSYGVLEELRRTPVIVAGREARMLDQVDAISSVSGGSFTALAYALYGDRLFDVFEPDFLKRDVEQELISDVLNPFNWGPLLLTTVTRSDLASSHYDDILFKGATFGDLAGKPGPLVVASSTEFASGYRFTFTQDMYDVICADLSATRLSTAATASSAVPVAFAPVTLTNWGGTCGPLPGWFQQAKVGSTAEALSLYQRISSVRELADSKQRPWLHLVDGGVSDNLGLRAVLDLMEVLELQEEFHKVLNLGKVRRVAVIVVNSAVSPPSGWNRSPTGPNLFDTILQASTVPIDNNSMDSVIIMELMIERWRLAAEVQSFKGRLDTSAGPTPPRIDFYPIVLDFAGIPDPTERKFFNSLPTTFDLPAETVDRLRAMGGTLLRASPQFQQFLHAVRGPSVPREGDSCDETDDARRRLVDGCAN